MKKILSLIVVVLLLVSCLGVTVNAAPLYGDYYEPSDEFYKIPAHKEISFSEDYKELYLGEKTYSRFNTYGFYLDTEYQLDNPKIINDKSVSEIYLTANKKGTVIDATISYNDGAELHCSFMENKYLEEYKNIIANNSKLFVDFSLNGDKYIEVDAEKLFAKKVTLKTEDFMYDGELFYVSAFTSDKSIEIPRGELYILPDTAYFSSYDMNKNNYGNDGEEWILYEVQDEKLIKKLNESVEEYYSDMEYGTLMNKKISKSITILFYWAFLIILPFIVMIASIILMILSKTKIYKRIYLITSILAATQTVIFVICNFILFK